MEAYRSDGKHNEKEVNIKIDLHVHDSSQERILNILNRILDRLETMANELATLTTEVSEATTVMDSARVLIEGLAQQIKDNIGNPQALAKLASDLDTKSNELSAAVVANTTPVPPVDPNA